MTRWRKLLEQMARDPDPRNYRYDEVVTVLRGLDFQEAPRGTGSHRAWRGLTPLGTVVVIGLVDKGRGTLKPYLIREMLKQLRASGFTV